MTSEAIQKPASWQGRRGLRAGFIGLLLFLLVAFSSIIWTPYPIDSLDVGSALQDPGPAHWLGTDHLGRDVVSLLMKGLLTSFIVALVGAGLGAAIGLPLGVAIAAATGSKNWFVSWVGNLGSVFPALVIAVLIGTLVGPSLIVVTIAIAVASIPGFARLTRDAFAAAQGLDYVATARLSGMSGPEIARRHVLPGLTGVVLGEALGQVAAGILVEASLSYVGIGAQAPTSSLGLMLREAQVSSLLKPSLVLAPGVTVVLLVLAIGLALNGLRGHKNGLRGDTGAGRGAA